ncbi:unnamed protein product, partial [Brenthis ino]
MDIALNGFKETGLWPCDRNVIKEEDFVASVYISNPSNQKPNDPAEPNTESSARIISPILTPPIVASIPMTAVSPPIVSSLSPPGPSTILQDISHDNNILTVDEMTNEQQIKTFLNILSPVPCIKTVTKK